MGIVVPLMAESLIVENKPNKLYMYHDKHKIKSTDNLKFPPLHYISAYFNREKT